MARSVHPRLYKLRKKRRQRAHRPPPYTIPKILAWADAHFQRTGKWPKHDSGSVKDVLGLTWEAIQVALQQGHRGLPGGSTLARLLGEHRGVRSNGSLPRLTEAEILRWADHHQNSTGKWPNENSGVVLAAPPETWS